MSAQKKAALAAPAFSDESLALAFAERCAHKLRYVAAWSKWMIWTGTHWHLDNTLHAFSIARETCREAALTCNEESQRRPLASARTVAAVASLARADRRIAATVDQWDSDPWLLNTPRGVVDLRTGKQRAHRAEDYMTKIAGTAPALRALHRFGTHSSNASLAAILN